MHTRGIVNKRVYFSHGDFTEGFMFCEYPKPLDPNKSQHMEGTDSGWIEIKGPLFAEFSRIINTGKFRPITVADEHGVAHKFSVADVKLLHDEYLNHCFERMSDASEAEKRKIVKAIGLATLTKIASRV